jgi:hypothetical protein
MDRIASLPAGLANIAAGAQQSEDHDMSIRFFSTALVLTTIAAGCSKANDRTAANSDSAAGSVAESTKAVVDSAKAVSLPPSVAALAAYGEDLYDRIKSDDWAKAATTLDSLDAAAKTLPPKEPQIQKERATLTAVIDTLRRAVESKNKPVALETSNRVTYLAARMTDPYHPAEPSAVPLLDYYGRELEIWSARGNRAKLRSTVAEIKTTWAGLRPKVEANQGAAVAKKTDSLVTLIAAAKSPAEQGKLAKPFLDVVDELEKVFVRQ